MHARTLVVGLGLVLGILAGCDDTVVGGEGGGTGGGEPDGDGGASSSSSLPDPVVTSGSTPLRTPSDICGGACACDTECAADPGPAVSACVERFAEDGDLAQRTGCGEAYEAYFGCFSREWSCSAQGACDDEVEALTDCVAVLCDQAATLCGYPSYGECRDPWSRCIAACVVSSSCSYDDAYYTCENACYEDEYGSSSVSGSGSGGGF